MDYRPWHGLPHIPYDYQSRQVAKEEVQIETTCKDRAHLLQSPSRLQVVWNQSSNGLLSDLYFIIWPLWASFLLPHLPHSSFFLHHLEPKFPSSGLDSPRPCQPHPQFYSPAFQSIFDLFFIHILPHLLPLFFCISYNSWSFLSAFQSLFVP